MVEVFQCSQTTSNRYKISLLKPSVKALTLSSKVSVRTDTRGFLSLQYMIMADDGQVCFVEYYVSAYFFSDLSNDRPLSHMRIRYLSVYYFLP